jgi:hypothetical protein
VDVLDLGCGYHVGYLKAMHSRLRSGTGIDYRVSEKVQNIPRLRFVQDSIESALHRVRVARIQDQMANNRVTHQKGVVKRQKFSSGNNFFYFLLLLSPCP